MIRVGRYSLAMKSTTNTQNVFGRFLFASLITYIATQAHGWAGGVATPYWFTSLTWVLVTFVSLRIQSKTFLLGLALGVQLVIHFGSMVSASHQHEMNTSNTSMVIGHIVAGIAAWAITVLAERPFIALDIATKLFGWHTSISFNPLRTFNWSLKTFYSSFINTNQVGRAPPASFSY